MAAHNEGNREALLQSFDSWRHLAEGTAWDRFIHQPFRYTWAQAYRRLVFPVLKKGLPQTCRTFWGKPIQVELPASMDIFFTGGKTHDSEIRLAHYLLRTLRPHETVIDIGAHVGYYSLLFDALLPEGSICSIEASPATFAYLEQNLKNTKARPLHLVLSDREEELVFYEYPSPFSEYNTLADDQYAGAGWRHKIQPRQIRMKAITLDELCQREQIRPSFLKLDVEGAEYKVLLCARRMLQAARPRIALEFLSDGRDNKPHQAAAKLLRELGYAAYGITPTGGLEVLSDIPQWLAHKGRESDNLVFLPV